MCARFRLTVLAGMLCALGAVVPAASAEVNTASAFGVRVQGPVNAGPVPTVAMPPGGTNIVASVNVSGTLTTGVLQVTAGRRSPPFFALFADAQRCDRVTSVGPVMSSKTAP